MPDITMCSGEGCPIKRECYRYHARPTAMRQSWFTQVPFDHDTGSCEHYWFREADADSLRRAELMEEMRAASVGEERKKFFDKLTDDERSLLGLD